MNLGILDATVWTAAEGTPGLRTTTSIGIEDGEISFVGHRSSMPTSPDRTIDGSDLFVRPGLIDAHAHTGLRLASGLAQDVPEIEWMTHALGPVAQVMDAQDHVIGSRLGVLEAILSGVTTIAEYTSDVQTLIEEVHLPAGLRVVAIETINEVVDRPEDGPYELSAEAGDTDRARADALVQWSTTEPRCHPMYGPQALDMVTLETMDELFDKAASTGHRLCVHLAQGGRERQQLEARYGVSSAVELLKDHDWIDPRLVAVHGHGATDDERDRLARAGVSLIGCPSSIAGIDGMAPPIASYLDAGGTVGLGTDQAPGGGGSHTLLNEVRQAWLAAKIAHTYPTKLPSWQALRLATIDGARALGIDDEVGSIEVGKRADIACFDLTTQPLSPSPTVVAATPIANLVSAGAGADVAYLIVDGKLVINNGYVQTLEPAGVTSAAIEQAEHLHEQAEDAWLDAGSQLAEQSIDGAFSIDDSGQ